MKNIIKNFIVMPIMVLGLVAGSFAMFAQTADAANVSLQAPIPTVIAANHSDCNGCNNWQAEGYTHATGDAQNRPIVSVAVEYWNTGNQTAQNVKVRLSPTSGNGGTTYFTGHVWANNASQLSGNATVTIPSNQEFEFIGLYHYKNGSNNPISLNASASSLSSGYSIGNIPAGDYGGVVARFQIEDNTPPAPTYDLDVNTLSATNVSEYSAKLRGQSNSNGIPGGAEVWFEYTTSANALSTNGTGQNASLTSQNQHSASYSWLTHNRTVNNLSPNTTYYYQMCADNGIEIECDPYESFTTDSVIINTPEQVATSGATGIDEDSATLNGYVISGNNLDTWFVIDDSSNPSCSSVSLQESVSGLYDTGDSFDVYVNNLQDDTTYYFRACSTNDNGNVMSFTTDENIVTPPEGENVATDTVTGIDDNSATLHGEVIEGNNVDTWFVITDNTSNPSCSTVNYQEAVSGLYDAGDSFSVFADNLDADTTYYFRACSTDDSGSVLSFTTDDTQGGNNEPDATTYNEQDVDEDSAELNGYVDMNDFDNGIVFFVYGQDEDRIDDVEQDHDSWNDVDNDEDQDDFMNEVVDWDLDGAQSYSQDVYNLDENEDYYFRICVEYENNNSEELECGNVKDFDTDGENGDDEPDATTENAQDVDEDSARLHGEIDMNDFDNGRVFFVYGQDEDQIDDVESDYDSYNDVDEDGDDLQKELVDSDLDSQDDYTESVTGLDENTDYYFRICVEYDDEDGDETLECGGTKHFETDDDFTPENNDRPIPGACAISNIGITSATLSARVDGNGNSTTSYFQYGRTTSFGSNTTTSSTGSNTNIVSKFVSSLSPNTTYYCRIVSTNSDGVSYGDIGTFRTRTLTVINPERPVTVVTGGAGSPIFLEIDDEQEVAARGQVLQYDVRWENISGRDLEDVVLHVQLPKSVRFTSATDGRYNKRDHNVTVNIGELEAGEEDDMVIFGVVRGGAEGDQLVAEATIAFEDPQGETRGLLATIEYDVDTYTNGANGLLAGLFGIGFLPGIIGLLLAILLILIIVLVARRVTEPRHTGYRG